ENGVATTPVFRDNGNALVGGSGICNDDSVVLVELSPEVELVQSFDDVLLPQLPVSPYAMMVGDDWVIATGGCDSRIASDGTLTEVCEDTRVQGNVALESADDDHYIAFNYDRVAMYPAGSPQLGDEPTWSQSLPTNSNESYYYYDGAFAASG